MKFKLISLILIVVVASILLSSFAISPRPYRAFEIIVPEEVLAYPNETVTIEGGVLNKGIWLLHDFHLTLSDLPEDYEYEFSPGWWEHLMTIREWTPERGVYRVPVNFTLTIKVPEDAYGIHRVNITGQEFMSWRKVSNSTEFILKVITFPDFTITNLIVPEEVTEFEPFDMSFSVNNIGEGLGKIDISIELPEDWDISEKSKSLTLEPDTSESVELTITPTNTSGEILIYAEYPFKELILNITKVGPYLIPTPVGVPVEEPEVPTGFAALLEFLKELSPLVIGIAIVLLLIIAWSAWGIYKSYGTRREPEEMKKKQVESTTFPEL